VLSCIESPTIPGDRIFFVQFRTVTGELHHDHHPLDIVAIDILKVDLALLVVGLPFVVSEFEMEMVRLVLVELLARQLINFS